MVERIIAFSLALIPFFCWQGWNEGIRTPKEIASIVSLIAIVGVSLFTYSLKPFKNKWILILLGWCYLTTLFSIHIPLYFKEGVLQLPSQLIAYKSLFYITISILSIICISSIPINLNKMARVINWVVVGLCLYGIVQIFGCDEFFRVADQSTGFIASNIWSGTNLGINGIGFGDLTHRVVATTGNPAILGLFLAICLPFSFYRIKNEGKFSLILGLLFIAITHSSTAILCVMLSSIFYFFFTNKKIMFILIILSLLGGGIIYYKAPSLFKLTGRVEVIKESWKVLYQKPLTGMGLGSWERLIGEDPEMVAKLKGQNWRETHNEYWQAWFEVGLIGLILFLLALWNTSRRFLKNINHETIILASSFMAIVVASLTYFTLRVGPLAIYSVLIFGLLENKIGEAK